MLEHAKYEEFCALAAVGQISAEESAEFQAHLQECSHCRGLHQELLGINSIWLTQAQELEPQMYGQHSVLRTKILRTLEDAGAQFSEQVHHELATPAKKFRLFEGFRIPGPAWAFAALSLIAGYLGFEVGAHKRSPIADTGSAAVKSVPIPTPLSSHAGPLPKAQPVVSAPQNPQQDLEERLAMSESARSKALADLQSLKQNLTALQGSRDQDAAQIAQLKARSAEDQNAASSAQAQIHSLQQAQDAKNADLVATQIQLRDLEGKLADQRTATEREQALAEVASSSEMRDVIASRNLHIIDVADVTNSGVRKPFGRIFYTEGKSLIFYAYDLSGGNGTKTFYAWGHREGDSDTTRALGSLHLDDPAQRRWVFKSNDAKVLAQIDSVYVTLEPTAKAGERPKGQKILSAFLGTQANHP
jgi:Putative zinc-finger